MRSAARSNVVVILIAGILSAPLCIPTLTTAQETRERRIQNDQNERTQKAWPAEQSSITKTAGNSDALSATNEPILRIALSTDTRAATISTTAQLLNVSEINAANQPLDTARLRIESRFLSPSRQRDGQLYEIEIARGLSRDEADRMIDQIQQLANEAAHANAESVNKWRVVITKDSATEAEAISAKLEDAGFDVVTSFKTHTNEVLEATPKQPSESPRAAGTASKVKLTARASAPNRELVAFAHGSAPLFHSSAPLTLASSDEANAPVRFNDKPYRGKIEVFANTRGNLTVVNVIGLEDYVRGVVPNELSYPALEALKAQAIAARTYAIKNRGQFAAEGFDLLPTTRSQVYRGLSSETSLTTRAVDETRGMIATYNGEPINALYTSTCGGRTEDAENIFNEAVPYLRGRECAAETKVRFAPFTIKSARDLFDIKDERDLVSARDAALLAVNGFSLPADKVSSSWFAAHVSDSEAREWIETAARLAHNPSFKAPEDITRTPRFSTALVAAIFGEGRADTLLNSADVEYLLGFRDAEEIPATNRADVAMLLRDGALSLFVDASLRPKETMSRSRVLRAIAHLLEMRNLLALQKGTTRPATAGLMMLRSNKGKDQPIVVSREAFLFREFGGNLYQMKSMALVGGEPVTFHVRGNEGVDYLEVRPAPNGAAADRFSSLSNWTTELSLNSVQARLGRSVPGVGSITDLRVDKRGASRRVVDLEVIGTQGVGHIRNGRIRSALGLKEQLFVIDKVYNDENRLTGFIFIGRGWGHGVGMCQFGAYGLAKQGYTVEQILKTYYTGIELTKMY